MLQGHTTRVIEDKATSRTVEERLTELVLQAPERPGQGRLRDVQRTRRDAHGANCLSCSRSMPHLFKVLCGYRIIGFDICILQTSYRRED